MTAVNDLPSYQDVFGALDFVETDVARTVYSPAAYLADLLQLIDDVFDDADLLVRRPDIGEVPLDGRNTTTLIPYLDIVIERLEVIIAAGGADPDETLRSATVPFNLPFSRHAAEAEVVLRHLGASLRAIHRAFHRDADGSIASSSTIAARDVLGLSAEMVDAIIIERRIDSSFLAKYFGIQNAPGDARTVADVPVELLLSTMEMSGGDLRELLAADLSASARHRDGRTEVELAGRLFVNRGLRGFAYLDEDLERVAWSGEGGIPFDWFDRVDRIWRLSQATGIGLIDLDRILRQCTSGALDANSLWTIAAIVSLHRDADIALDVATSLFSDIDTLGQGNGQEPADLFNRTFNGAAAVISGRLMLTEPTDPVGRFVHPAYSEGFAPLDLADDITAPGSADFRRRISLSLGISNAQLIDVVERFRTGDPYGSVLASSAPLDVAALSTLHRVALLAQITDLGISDVLDVFTVLETDPSIRRFSNFDLLVGDDAPYEPNCFRVIAGNPSGNQADSLRWLVQTVVAIGDWMGRHDLSGRDLLHITGAPTDDPTMGESTSGLASLFATLVSSFVDLELSPNTFESIRFDARTARVIHRSVGDSALTPDDDRLVGSDPVESRTVAGRALRSLDVIHDDDFVDVGIAERFTDKLIENLVIRGIVDASGVIDPGRVPLAPDQFKIAGEFEHVARDVFDLIASIRSNDSDNSDDDLLVIFESDLLTLEMSSNDVRELYGNLIYARTIDEDGAVADPAYFTDAANRESFTLSTMISDAAGPVHQLLLARLQRFADTPLVLPDDLFGALGLAPLAIADLWENLGFNDYLDENGVVIDGAALEALDSTDFLLSPMFHPHRAAVLELLKGAAEDHRNRHTTIDRAQLADVAASTLSRRIARDVLAEFGAGDRLAEHAVEFFGDLRNADGFTIDPSLDDDEHAAVFSAVGRIVDSADDVRFGDARLEALGLDDDTNETLFQTLVAVGAIDDARHVPSERVAYFLAPANAVDFRLEGFEDESTDLFFMLNEIARNVDEQVAEITTALDDLAIAQESAVLAVLGEHYETSIDVVDVVSRHVLGNRRGPVETWMSAAYRADPNHGLVEGYRRIGQFVLFAGRLRLDAADIDIVARDQNLADKFPEPFDLPDDVNGLDALAVFDVPTALIQSIEESLDDDAGETAELPAMVSMTCVFRGQRFWAYAPGSRTPSASLPITSLGAGLAEIERVDAAFVDEDGASWLLVGARYFRRAPGAAKWILVERTLAALHNEFNDPEHIDAAYTDAEGRSYLFAGEQYIRCSGNDRSVDEGYPKLIAESWSHELGADIPEDFSGSFDAAFHGPLDEFVIFRGERFASTHGSEGNETAEVWGRVRNDILTGGRVDAALLSDGRLHLVVGDQEITYSGSIEDAEVLASDGSLRRLGDGLPDLDDGIDAMLAGAGDDLDDVRLFSGERYVASSADGIIEDLGDIRSWWGLVDNRIATSGEIDAAFVGLDGRTYLFSGDQYVRYSSAAKHVDEGYPRTIATDWGGLTSVDAAFVLDGKTYLFGDAAKLDESDGENESDGESDDESDDDGEGVSTPGYVRYSTNDYSIPDEGFPRDPGDNWWALPDSLVEFTSPDAVVTDADGNVHLFTGGRFVTFEALHRWWSEPEALRTKWDSYPFDSARAGFTSATGKTYLFGDDRYVRYSDGDHTRLDDKYPKDIATNWGQVDNEIQRSGRVDAAVRLRSPHPEDGRPDETVTYVFSGGQFFRYTHESGDQVGPARDSVSVDEGYPRSIRHRLRLEPRFANLGRDLRGRVDAAFGDDRTVSLFAGDECLISSIESAATYPGTIDSSPNCVFSSHGELFAELNRTWHRVTAFEPPVVREPGGVPRLLRNVPDGYRHDISAVLEGADGALHVFPEGDVGDMGVVPGRSYNSVLDAQVSIVDEWGQVRNDITASGRVDSALAGVDGNFYLFSGDRFVTYAPDPTGDIGLPRYIDGLPEPIADRWGGLRDVDLAYARNGVTHLFEFPDADGRARHVSYTGDEYGEPDGEPEFVDFSWWEIPDEYVDNGFDRVDAVLVENDDMWLIRGTDFVHFDAATDQWTYPRPLDRILPHLPASDDGFDRVGAAFRAPGGSIVLFAGDQFVVHDREQANAAPLRSVADRWGRIDNRITEDGWVDAAVRHPDGPTYLFSGDQYVRYSTGDYRYVDEGYPKLTVDELRSEAPFAELADTAIESLRMLFHGSGRLDAVVTDGRTTSLFHDGHVHVCSQSVTATVPVARLGSIRNNIAETGVVDAALTSGTSTYLFSDDQYVRYSGTDFDVVDSGYPKTIRHNAEGWPAVGRVDAALVHNDTICLFTDERVVEFPRVVSEPDVADAAPQLSSFAVTDAPIAGRWGVVHNPFASDDGGPVALDAAFVAPDGSFYAFNEEWYVRKSAVGNADVDAGYPRTIRDDWGDLPVEYEARLAGGFVLDGRTYLMKHVPWCAGGWGEYVRYSDTDYRRIDPIFPRPFVELWGSWNDFGITDLHTISRYADLRDSTGSGDDGLRELLGPESVESRAPFETLAALFGWDVDQVIWMKQADAFLSRTTSEANFDLETVIKMADVFAVADAVGTTPSDLLESVWRPLFQRSDIEDASIHLTGLLEASVSATDWALLSREIHNEMNAIRRDALVPFVRRMQALETNRDLYEYLLIDSQTASIIQTSRIKEAITAVQLYIHRFLVNLERVEIRGDADDAKRHELKRWWTWMRNYRVWEANRKVFLYPENYLRPELRDTKTPAFLTLEDDLMQGEVTEASVTTAYMKYVDAYTEVSRLTIAGGYVYTDTDPLESKRLVLFGRTKTDPARFYYRTGSFAGGSTTAATWGPWLDTQLKIESAKVSPVHAFGRDFVFWTTVETEPVESTSRELVVVEDKNKRNVSGQDQVRYVVRIWFSFRDLNGNWAPPQSLETRSAPGDPSAATTAKITSAWPVRDLRLFVENSTQLDGHAHENIVVSCRYKIGFWAWTSEPTHSFHLTPELYTKVADQPRFADSGIDVFAQLFPREAGSEKRAVPLNTVENPSDGPWFSFDHKGGSFLVKPTQPSLVEANRPKVFEDSEDELPKWDRVDAAAEAPDGTRFYFRDDRYVTSDDLEDEHDVSERWGSTNAIRRDGRVDAVLDEPDRDRIHVFRGDEYMTFESPTYDVAIPGSPRKMSDSPDIFPGWPSIDAAFVDPAGTRHFFDNTNHQFVTSEDLGQARMTKARWGKVRNAFTDPSVAAVTAAFETHVVSDDDDDETSSPGAVYVVNGAVFARSTTELSAFVDPGYPRGGGVQALLEDIGFVEVDDSYANVAVDAGHRRGDVLVLDVGRERLACDLASMTITSGKPARRRKGATYEDANGNVHESDEYTAALVTADELFLFKDGNYMRLAEPSDDLDELSWRASGRIGAKFGRQHTSLAETGRVDAVLRVGGTVYMFTDDEYVRYSADESGELGEFIDGGYPRPLSTNDEGLVPWTRLGAAFRGQDEGARTWYFEHDGAECVSSDDMTTRVSIAERWGGTSDDVFMNGVSAAYTDDDGHLFLIGENTAAEGETPLHRYIRVSPDDNDGFAASIDAGYPRDVGGGRKIDAAFVLDGRLHFFSGDSSASVPATSEPDASLTWTPMKGTWGNLSADFETGFHAALQQRSRTSLQLFKGDRVVTYELDGTSAEPYLVATATFDVVRLTTSTGHELNRRLLTGGLDAMLDIDTQQIDEIPNFEISPPLTAAEQQAIETHDSFEKALDAIFGLIPFAWNWIGREWRWAPEPILSPPTTINYDDKRIGRIPHGSHLDYDSANGIYYWEVFFHVPLLIARALSVGQRFEESKRWYEFVFDPTEREHYWKFLPFVAVDTDALVAATRAAIADLIDAGVPVEAVAAQYEKLLPDVVGLGELMRGHREPTEDDRSWFNKLPAVTASLRNSLDKLRSPRMNAERVALFDELTEWNHILDSLPSRYELLRTGDAQIEAYHNDPFDPHAIAGLRRVAYAKSVVMAYVDNLLDWGDHLFRRYTIESISEARMLYVLANDLLGRKPQHLGHRVLSPTRSYLGAADDAGGQGGLDNPNPEYQFLLGLETADSPTTVELSRTPTVHDSVANSYFHIPENTTFLEYWDRAEDRLHKIRNSLDIDGVFTPLPLFQPPIDPMALVQAVGSGAALSDVVGGAGAVPIPHYRFEFMLTKARELTQKVSQFGEQLLQALEKRDAEELTLIQQRQEAAVRALTRDVREAQLHEVEATIASLTESRANAAARVTYYERLIATGMSPTEIAQVSLMSAGAAANLVAGVLKIIAAIAYPIPEVTAGLFSFGATTGGSHVGKSLETASDVAQSIGEGLSMTGEAIGIGAAYERMSEEWDLQLLVSESEVVQMDAQLIGADWQREAARTELAIVEREITHNEEVTAFMRDKFTSEQLYQWMSGRLSTTYFQTYKLAHDMARYAEQALRFERGLAERDATFIQPVYWDGRRKGLLAGDTLGLDLDRMESAYIKGNGRLLEISKNISLVELDPLAFLALKSDSQCEFRLPESLFDHDFPGHYCRQVKTVSLTFDMGDGRPVMATLTQLGNQTVLDTDAKAVKFLLEAKGAQPVSIRSDWRATQQIALSHVGEYDDNNGLFELRFDDERYLPFEGTGAVSSWRLELNGKRGSYDVRQLSDVTVNVKYTAINGGEAFATTVKGLLKPYAANVLIDLADDFADEWESFLAGDSNDLMVPVDRELFPDMTGSKVSAVVAHFEYEDGGGDDGNPETSIVLDGDEEMTLRQDTYVETPGLAVKADGSTWQLSFNGERERLRTVHLVAIYRARVA